LAVSNRTIHVALGADIVKVAHCEANHIADDPLKSRLSQRAWDELVREYRGAAQTRPALATAKKTWGLPPVLLGLSF